MDAWWATKDESTFMPVQVEGKSGAGGQVVLGFPEHGVLALVLKPLSASARRSTFGSAQRLGERGRGGVVALLVASLAEMGSEGSATAAATSRQESLMTSLSLEMKSSLVVACCMAA